MNNEKVSCVVAPCPISEDILNYAGSLAEQLNHLTERVHGKLRPVMSSELLSTAVGDAIKRREYPPLFEELRNRFDSIQYSIESIENALSRTEL